MHRTASHIALMQNIARSDSLRWWPDVDDSLPFLTLALCGEAGELANMVKKTIRGDMDPKKALDRNLIVGEAVDVFTYNLLIANRLGIDLERAYDAKRAENERRWGNRVGA